MFHHVSVGVTDVAAAARFYDAVLAALGYRRLMDFLPRAAGYGADKPLFWIQLPRDEGEASAGNGAHVAFAAPDRAAVRAFHAAALEAGGRDNGPPGPRPNYGPEYYGAFVIDPDGNRLEAVVKWGAERPKAVRRTASGVPRRSKRTASSGKAGRGAPARRRATGPRKPRR